MISFLETLVRNSVIIIPVLAWVIAQILKFFMTLIFKKKLDFRKLTTAGGMPSSHSAMVTSLAVKIGLLEGWGSPIFALSAIFGLIVMYDAAGVRRAAGRQAVILNKMVREVYKDRRIHHERLKEFLGHTPVEVMAGATLGAVLAMVF